MSSAYLKGLVILSISNIVVLLISLKSDVSLYPTKMCMNVLTDGQEDSSKTGCARF